MIRYQFFPRSHGINAEMAQIVNCFVNADDKITSDNKDLTSNEVLAMLRPHFEDVGYTVESGKSKGEKIDVPVLFGVNNKVDKSFLRMQSVRTERLLLKLKLDKQRKTIVF